jgi:hypothetical protein
MVAGAIMVAVTGCGDDDPPQSALSTPQTTTELVVTTTTPPTAAGTTTVSTTEPVNTLPPAISTTVAPTVPLSGATLEVVSPVLTNPFVLERVGESGGLVVYDGVSVDGDFSLRCVAVGHDGATAWTEWCALPGDSGTFAVIDGDDPWVVDVGAEPGDVTFAQQPSTWAVTTSGCVEPLVTLVAAIDLVHPVAVTNVACADDLAVLTYSGVYMQPGSGDGGGVLVARGDEGWNTVSSGTSMGCDGMAVECERFKVGTELFDAASPIPSPDLIAAQEQFINVRDATAEVTALAESAGENESGEAADIDAITDAIVAGLTQSDAEVAPSMTRHDGVSFDRYSLLIVEVPAMDDSVTSTTWAAWITTATPELPATVHRAYAWDICGRGMADASTCV